jgi:hypothetical protein
MGFAWGGMGGSFPGAVALLFIMSVLSIGVYWAVSAILWSALFGRLARLWRRKDVPGQPRCVTCGYSLIGNRSMRCPECGRAFEVSELGYTDAEWERLGM